MPLSAGEMRPSGETAVASTITSPAPPTARLPRCTRCQSVGIPSTLEYWHIGETHSLLLNSTLRKTKCSNNLLIKLSPCSYMDHDLSQMRSVLQIAYCARCVL